MTQHAACPFGAVASVHAWERVGAAIAHLARKFLKITVLRYVDDFFAPERLGNYYAVVMACAQCATGQKQWSTHSSVWHGSFGSYLGPLRWQPTSWHVARNWMCLGYVGS